MDLDGDGLTDIIRSGTLLECFFNAPNERDAWGRVRFAERRRMAEFPNVTFSDPPCVSPT